MTEPEIFAAQAFPRRFTRLLKMGLGRPPMRIILLATLVLAALNLPGAASVRPPIFPSGDHPNYDRQVMFAIFNEVDITWKLSSLPGSKSPTPLRRFGEQDIWFFYGVKPSTPRKGALSIRVSRFFGEAKRTDIDKVNLYRNEGFQNARGQQVKELTDYVGRREYVDFHEKNLIDPWLENGFHAYWERGDEYYTAYNWRRGLFRFPSDDKTAKSLQMSYLLWYETSELGSWIPFFIGTGGEFANQLQQIRIVMTDIGANSADAEVERTLVQGE